MLLSRVLGLLLLALGTTSKEWCLSHCVTPCTELIGDLTQECGGCKPEMACNPSAEGYDSWKERRTQYLAENSEEGKMEAAENSVENQEELWRHLKCPETLPEAADAGLYVTCAHKMGKTLDTGAEFMQSPDPVYSDDHSKFFLIRNTPLFLSKMPQELIELKESYIKWVLKMEPEWRKNNGGILQVSYKGSENGYILIKEAFAAGGDVAKFAKGLKTFIKDQWLVMMREYRGVVSKASSEKTMNMLLRPIIRDMCEDPISHECKDTSENVSFYTWMNVFHQGGEWAGEAFKSQMHDHSWDWHGYVMLNTAGTGTSFLSPDEHVFMLKHTDNYVILMPGGIYHAAHESENGADPRVTMAFDIGLERTTATHGTNLMEGEDPIPEGNPVFKMDETKFRSCAYAGNRYHLESVPIQYSWDEDDNMSDDNRDGRNN